MSINTQLPPVSLPGQLGFQVLSNNMDQAEAEAQQLIDMLDGLGQIIDISV